LLPQLAVDGQRLALHAHAAGSLADHAGEIRDALDAVVSGI
jgi:hypothetical protein